MHYSCLNPRPEKRPKVWDCDDCLVARGKPPNNNIRKKTGNVPGGRTSTGNGAGGAAKQMPARPLIVPKITSRSVQQHFIKLSGSVSGL